MCKLHTDSDPEPGSNLGPRRREAAVLPLHHRAAPPSRCFAVFERYKKIKDCDGNEKTKCEKCKADEYLDYPNYTNHCIRCSYCEEGSNLVMAARCSPTANTQCQCKRGYYCSSRQGTKCERCRKITCCGPGQGITEKATENSDNVCGPCPSGTYSNATDSISPCQRHTHCALIGQYILIPGTAIADSICTSFLSTSQKPSAVTTAPNYPNQSDWSMPLLICSGLLFTAIAIIATLVYMRKRRKRAANIAVSHPAASHVQSDHGLPTMTASEIFNSGNHHTTLGPLAILISPPNPEWCQRPESDSGLGGTGGGGLDLQQLIVKSVSCPGQVGKHPSVSNLQPEEDEWMG
ncbi:tumor necrosis factor receptor superfamily member 5-like isoform X2 [Scyliorhinus torazame]|uniref:tumor necrosis factor receptor superfamily member 5-like isoform X2 n=1 Tax=Scyliorhinus torazame TaxID=75743 RepID=UPI003B58BA6F